MSNPRFAKAVSSEHMSAGWREHRWIGALLILLAVIVVTALVASRFETHPSGIAAGVSPVPITASSSFEITAENNETAPINRPAGMDWIPGGEFSMGAQDPPDFDDEVSMNATYYHEYSASSHALGNAIVFGGAWTLLIPKTTSAKIIKYNQEQ